MGLDTKGEELLPLKVQDSFTKGDYVRCHSIQSEAWPGGPPRTDRVVLEAGGANRGNKYNIKRHKVHLLVYKSPRTEILHAEKKELHKDPNANTLQQHFRRGNVSIMIIPACDVGLLEWRL